MIASRIELVIFDCDGVLVDSEPIINQARAHLLTACGLSCRLIGARWEVRGRNQGGNHAHRDPIACSLQAGSLEQGPLDRPEAPSQADILGSCRSPEEEARHPLERPPMGNKRVYETFDAALARFRLMPEQLCENPFIVEFIGRHSLRRAEDGWVWKFDSEAMGSRRFGEPVREYLQAVGCRAALIFGEKSALVSRETASYMSSLMGPRAPVVEVPEARHHVMLDQPLGFVAALRMLLDSWMRNESAEGSG